MGCGFLVMHSVSGFGSTRACALEVRAPRWQSRNNLHGLVVISSRDNNLLLSNPSACYSKYSQRSCRLQPYMPTIDLTSFKVPQLPHAVDAGTDVAVLEVMLVAF